MSSFTYGQFCPVSKAMEILDERWTMLVIRELMLGSRSFNDLRRGVPRMSPALLSTRLRSLAHAGIIVRHEHGRRITYTLTQAGLELRPIVEALGVWGTRWIPELGDEDLDPHLLMWDIHRRIDLEAIPSGRNALQFRFRDVAGPAGAWWVVLSPEGADLCDFDPGDPTIATIDTDLRTMSRLWRGDIDWRQALHVHGLRLLAHGPIRDAVPRWLKLSIFAPVERPATHLRTA